MPRKAKTGKTKIRIAPGAGMTTDTARAWAKRAGQLERQAHALMRASEQCLDMAEAIRQARRKGKEQEEDIYASRKISRQSAG